MRERVGNDLPTFSEKDKEFIRNKIDFVGLNHYTSRLIAHHQNPGDIYFYQVQQVERIGTILQLRRKIVVCRHQRCSRMLIFLKTAIIQSLSRIK